MDIVNPAVDLWKEENPEKTEEINILEKWMFGGSRTQLIAQYLYDVHIEGVSPEEAAENVKDSWKYMGLIMGIDDEKE